MHLTGSRKSCVFLSLSLQSYYEAMCEEQCQVACIGFQY